ncbi:MAG: Fe-S cluster assembly protein IscX [Betaproteobacteria bacterium AqS2]|uniref:Fe-S cluster assembly protein IscX n=2 Tax=Candidatus Amphirhobacter heronislandensis TaxID=1732024 RepID=A0A930Y292_9GAMM|nr:Fe-S cluster assembly protein IscX [Betaproteobacteria bacterium AqS2]
MKWTDAQEIGVALAEAHPEAKPLEIRFTELHAMVCALEGFDDDPEASNERRLEAILTAWLEELD